MPLKPQESDFEEFSISGKRVYLDDLEAYANVLATLGPVVIEVYQSNGVHSEVEDLSDIYGRDIDSIKMVSRLADPTRLIGVYDVAIVEFGGPWFNRASIDKRHPGAIAAIRHLSSTLDTYRPAAFWRLRHPRTDTSQWVEILTERRVESRAAAKSRAHDVRVMLIGVFLGAVLAVIAGVLVGLFA